jgi:transposase
MISAVIERCAGIDVGKKWIAVCVLTGPAHGDAESEIRKFETTNQSLAHLAKWLEECGCTHVVMESTGEYWRPIYNVLEAATQAEIILANAQQVKGMRGHKTDPEDAHWLAHLLRHGMIRPSYIPPLPIRQLRDLTRRRQQLVRNEAQERNRVQKILEDANIKLGNVLTDLFGLSGQLMIDKLLQGEATVEEVADLAQRQARKKIPQIRAALEGHRLNAMHRQLINFSLDHMAFLEEQIHTLEEKIVEHIKKHKLEKQYQLLQTIPGVRETGAASLLAEFGPDMKVFGNAKKLSSWAGVAPGNNESAGKRKRAPALHGNPWARSTLTESAWSASRKKNSEFQTDYERWKPRLKHKRAIVAVAHVLAATVYEVLSTGQAYTKPGANPMPETEAARLIKHHTRRLKTLRKRLKPVSEKTAAPSKGR